MITPTELVEYQFIVKASENISLFIREKSTYN